MAFVGRPRLGIAPFTGGCAGSTSGGIKISRIAILCKSLKRELKRLAHPNHVSVIKMDGQAVEERVVSAASSFICAYLLVLLAGALVVSWDNYGFQESFAAMFPAPRQRWVDALATPEDVISALPHRTLVVHGRDDQVIPLANAHRLLELIDDSQLHVFGRCGHWTQIEHADEFNALVARFLR